MRAAVATIAMLLCTASARGHARKQVTLDWTMRVEGQTLIVDYTIVNKLDRQLTVVDNVTEKGSPLPGRLIVGMEELVRGQGDYPRPRVAFMKEPWAPMASEGMVDRATVAHLQPGESRHWTATMSLPLVAWAPTAPYANLDADSQSAVLLITYWVGNEGHPAGKIPRGCDEHFIVGRELELPAGVKIARQPKR